MALMVRLHSFVYSVYNYDESLYILMGSELARGNLPYTTVCDLKPFGLFGVFALLTSMPLDGVFTVRIAASLAVGLTAYLLCRIAALLFEDETRSIGITAGSTYVVFTLADGGLAAQAELFHNACAVLALFIMLRALRRRTGPEFATYAAAGLVLGVGLQIKQAVAFDMLAFLIGFYIITTERLRDLGRRLRSTLPGLAVLGAASLIPTLAVVLTYVLAGEWNAWVAGNITAHRVFYGLERPFELDPAFRAMWEQAPLWFGTILAACLIGPLTRSGAEKRAVLFLLVWVAAIIVCQLFLRISADHYFLQFLPSMSLLMGLLLGRSIVAALPSSRARSAFLVMFVGLTTFAIAKQPLIHSIYILRDRFIGGERWAGDTPRQIAAELRPILEEGDTLYVVGFQPLVYHLTGAKLATRFAFTGLPHRDYPGRDGCPWVEQAVAMQRILDSRPRFIVVEDGIFFHELRPEVKSLLTERLAKDYRLRKRFEQHHLHHLYPFERFVMNGGAAAELYELVEDSASS
jgi:hypothetical protein